MRLAYWLEDVLGSPTRTSVLRLLIRTFPTEYTLREMGRALGKGPSTVSVAVKALESFGVVETRRLGNSNGYRLRSTQIRSLLAELFETERKLERLAVRAIADATPRGTSSFLFGSAARGQQKSSSDLDILIIAKAKGQAETAAEQIRAATLQIGFLAPQTFAIGKPDCIGKKKEPWLVNARNDARHIAGPTLDAWEK